MNPSIRKSVTDDTANSSGLNRFVKKFTGAAFIVAYTFGMIILGASLMVIVTADPVVKAYEHWQFLEQQDLFMSNVPEDVSAECYTSMVKRASAVSELREQGTIELSPAVWNQPLPGCGPGPYIQ